MKVLYPIFFVFIVFTLPFSALAQENPAQSRILEGKILEVLEEEDFIDQDGTAITQQNLKIEITSDEESGKIIIFEGIGEYAVVAKNIYEKGDRVLLMKDVDFEGNDFYYVTDYLRTGKIYFLAAIFILAVITVGRWKGFMSLVSLFISFLVILKFIIPKILSGSSPLLISIVGGIVILFVAVYLTQGFNKKSHLINIALSACFIFTGIFSFIFTNVTKLTGFASEEAIYLIGINDGTLNIKGLLLAGILIGALGVLDDVIVSQVSLVEQIKKANPSLTPREVYKRALRVGVDHISSMTNTLFFAYAGAALPLLILFSIKQPPFLTFNQIISNEVIATEIVRTLVGSVGLILAIPISNYLASYFLNVPKADK